LETKSLKTISSDGAISVDRFVITLELLLVSNKLASSILNLPKNKVIEDEIERIVRTGITSRTKLPNLFLLFRR
jgi:hypothetical protein